MIVDRLEDLLGGNQQRGHFPDGHFKVHLGELEQSASRQSVSSVRVLIPVYSPTHLLKKRGMRMLAPRAGVEPKGDGPPC